MDFCQLTSKTIIKTCTKFHCYGFIPGHWLLAWQYFQKATCKPLKVTFTADYLHHRFWKNQLIHKFTSLRLHIIYFTFIYPLSPRDCLILFEANDLNYRKIVEKKTILLNNVLLRSDWHSSSQEMCHPS